MSEVNIYTLVMGEKEILGFRHGDEQSIGEFVKYNDYAELEAKCAALAAENAWLKSGAMDEIKVINRGGQAYCVKDGVQVNPMYARGWNDYRAKSLQSNTPATDAFLAEVRAQGVDAAIEHLINKFQSTGHIGVPVMSLEHFADQLRKGVDKK